MFISFRLVFIKSGQTLSELWAYILLGVLVGEALRLSPFIRLFHRYGSEKIQPRITIPVAAVLGMISPLCTYGTVPVVLQLFRAGMPLAPLVTFLSVSSLMNPQLFILTWGGLGMEMALVRAGAVLVFGLFLGLLLTRLPEKWIVNPNLETSCEEPEMKKNSNIGWRLFLRYVWKSLQYIGFYFLLGIFLGSVLEVFLPSRWVSLIFQPGKWYSVLLAAILGVPLYACGGGVIPLLRSLLTDGMSKGAALTFLLVGPATRITPLFALGTVLRAGFLAIYVMILIVFALVSGLIYH